MNLKNLEKLKTLNFNRIVYYFKYVLLLASMVSAISVFNNTIVRTFFKMLFVLSMLLLAYILIYKRKQFKSRNYLLLLLFSVCYGLTIVFNVRNHVINEIMLFGYTLMFFFVVTYFDLDASKKNVKTEIFHFMNLIICVSLIISIVNLILFGMEILGAYDFTELNSFYEYSKSNQLGGVYNPNTGSMVNLISILMSLMFMMHQKGNTKFYALNVTVQTICFSLCQSRGSWVCLITYLILYALFIYKHSEKIPYVKRAARFFTIFLFCVGLSLMTRQTIFGTFDLFSKDEVEEEVNRKEQKKDDIYTFSTGRSGLWKVGVEAWKSEPILGIGYRNIDDALKVELSEHDYNNSAKGGLHSTYVTTLVSVGLLGFGVLMIFLILLCYKGFKLLINPNVTAIDRMLISIVPMILVGELVESRILFGMNFVCVVFWIVMGYIFYLDRKMKTND